MISRVSYAGAAWAVLVFTLFVVLWGGFVSASGAGDGCGDDWPLCGELLSPSGTTPADAADTLVEFTHRATSGLALLAVAGPRRLVAPPVLLPATGRGTGPPCPSRSWSSSRSSGPPSSSSSGST